MSVDPSLESTELTGLARVWAEISAIGWREAILRYASHALILLLLLGAIWAGQTKLGLIERLLDKVTLNVTSATSISSPRETTVLGITTQLTVADSVQVSRLADVHTLIPTRGRSTVITYTV